MNVIGIENELLLIAEEAGAGDPSHDNGHILRVLRTARLIAEREGVHDAKVLTAAAILHDCVNLPKNNPRRSSASLMAADKAVDILKSRGFSSGELQSVHHAVHAHSFSAKIEPLTPEARALQDADRIDALGAIGIARCFAVSGKIGRALFDTSDPLAEMREPDDLTWALDHFTVKLLNIPGTMRTAAGREIADRRAEKLKEFIRWTAEECAGEA